MSAGQEKTVWIPVEKAYGPYRSDLVHAVSRGEFPANETPAVGQIYTARRTGSTAVNWFTVTKFNDTYVTIDENHMLSGQNLTFVIRVVSVNKGTA
jgi:peptidylprolyl isomerase